MKSDAQGSSFTHREEAHGIQANEAVGIVEETGDADGERRAVENKNTLAGDQRKKTEEDWFTVRGPVHLKSKLLAAWG